MKLVVSASGKQAIKISQKEWRAIGEKNGWITVAQTPADPNTPNQNQEEQNEQRYIVAVVKQMYSDNKKQQATGFHQMFYDAVTKRWTDDKSATSYPNFEAASASAKELKSRNAMLFRENANSSEVFTPYVVDVTKLPWKWTKVE